MNFKCWSFHWLKKATVAQMKEKIKILKKSIRVLASNFRKEGILNIPPEEMMRKGG